MKTVSAATLKERLLYYLDLARTEPILVQKKEGTSTVLISLEEYERLTVLEKNYWLGQDRKKRKTGYIGVEKSAELLKAGLNEKP